jgi:hypothetical protein
MWGDNPPVDFVTVCLREQFNKGAAWLRGCGVAQIVAQRPELESRLVTPEEALHRAQAMRIIRVVYKILHVCSIKVKINKKNGSMPEQKNKGITPYHLPRYAVITEIKKRLTFHEGLDLFCYPVHHEILGQAVHVLLLVHHSHSLAKVQGLKRMRAEGRAISKADTGFGRITQTNFSFFLKYLLKGSRQPESRGVRNVSICPILSRTAAIDVLFSINFAVIFYVFPFPPQ